MFYYYIFIVYLSIFVICLIDSNNFQVIPLIFEVCIYNHLQIMIYFSFLPFQYLYIFFFPFFVCATLTGTSRTMLSNGGALAPPYLVLKESWNSSFISSFSVNFAVFDISFPFIKGYQDYRNYDLPPLTDIFLYCLFFFAVLVNP